MGEMARKQLEGPVEKDDTRCRRRFPKSLSEVIAADLADCRILAGDELLGFRGYAAVYLQGCG